MVKANKGSFGRAARLARLGAGLAGSYLAHRLQRPFVSEEHAEKQQRALKRSNARKVREELQELRGPIMKLGQALSMQTQFLGNDMVQELSALQMHAPAMHPTLMRVQFKNSFGKPPEDMFHSFEPEPFAAASLGQVHRAITRNGEEVAVKIQYPAMREVIQSDFQALRTASFPARVTGHLKDSIIREVERGILEETDYLNEARNIDHFRKALAPLPFVHVPKVFKDLSSERVLTMSRVKGVRLQEFLRTNPSQELRDQLGTGLTRLFFFQLFKVRALHADPHPGNYLLNENGAIGLVDFGCVKYLKPEVVKCYAQFWSREWAHNEKLFAEIIRVICSPKVSPREPRVRTCMREICRFYDKYHPLDRMHQPLDLGTPAFMEDLGSLAKALLKGKFLSPEFIFLSRTESGLCGLLHALKARVTTTRIAMEWMASA